MQYRVLVRQWLLESAQLGTAVDAELAVLSSRQLDYVFHPRRWTIRQCLQHICLYNAAYFIQVESALGQLKESAPAENLRIRPVSTWLMRRVQPDNTERYLTRPAFDPRSHQYPDHVFLYFRQQQERLGTLLESSTTVDFNEPIIPVGPLNLFRLSVAEQLWYILQHEQKHVRQAMHLANLVPEDV